jgi:hypothetical protein
VTHEQLVQEIAEALAESGEYVREMEWRSTQHMVDLHWCAHRAGRRLGMKVRVRVVEASTLHRTDHWERVTMTVAARPADVGVMLP